MMSALVLRQRLEVRRAAAHMPASVDDWNLPTYDADTTVATVSGQIWPLKLEEVAALADAGAQVGDYEAIALATDIRTSDRIREGVRTFEVRSAVDAAGIGHHMKLLLRLVAP